MAHGNRLNEGDNTPQDTVCHAINARPPLSNEKKNQLNDAEEGRTQERHQAASSGPTRTPPVHSIFTPTQRRYIVASISCAALFSPVSANIYLPALNTLAQELSVSISMMNLTVTSYMVFQGLAPMFMGDLADTAGRRPAVLLCFIIYIAANIGLASQNHYAALLVLRCVQATGSSPTIALAAGVVADISTSAQRGTYMGWVTAGALLGPAVGPIAGGLLAQYLGWRAIFWFLVIFAAVFLVQFAVLFPETGRNIVGNGSYPPQKWNISAITYLKTRKASRKTARNVTDDTTDTAEGTERTAAVAEEEEVGGGGGITEEAESPMKPKLRFPNPIRSLTILREKDTFIVLVTNAIIFAVSYNINIAITSLFHEIYGYSEFQIGLCYIPIGAGACIGSIANGFLLDYNYRRIAKKLGVPVSRDKQQDLRHFPIERARLQVVFPMVFLSICVVIGFGWVLHFRTPVAAPLVLVGISGATLTSAVNTVSTLLVDVHPSRAATVTASNNLVRCLFGAGATAVISPMINRLGVGWCFTLIACIMTATAPVMLVVIRFGPKWREERCLKTEEMAAPSVGAAK
ncbi:hypothetical protein AJ78_03725 [Emergomyces pasteurianus Ep9510]|uniref:Major facilitator superfamily (MFS) profile domain-containing protein n=1 Tax=Emergomyces pasteurianus Ep9510 TaxID=1447872 RepID=A0A1J9QJL8_9EURO|nr:hypothetical protein AJ78_03725 [Emergomyces pasteurianus Ep9510]